VPRGRVPRLMGGATRSISMMAVATAGWLVSPRSTVSAAPFRESPGISLSRVPLLPQQLMNPRNDRQGGRSSPNDLEVDMRRIFAVLSLLLVVGCHGEPSPQPQVRATTPSPAIHFLVVHDVSSSIDGRVPRLDPRELLPVLEYAEAHGGTVGVISFGTRSRPSVRAVFDPPVAKKNDPHVNVFLREPDPDPQELARIEDEYRAYCTAERERFLSDVTTLLEESASATNLVSGLERAEAYFSESTKASARILLLISDFEDTTGTTSFDLNLDPGVRVFAVCKDIRSFGILQNQAANLETFESTSAAIRAAIPKRR
jgi:hypothetical protein